jgi:hypothetical protein
MARYAKFFSLGGGGGTNNLQLPVGTILDTTLRQVQDGTGTGSPLYLSTGGLRVGTTAGSAMYWDDVNNRLGIGTNTPTSILHVKGVGTTSTTTSLLTQSSTGTTTFSVGDDGNILVGASTITFGSNIYFNRITSNFGGVTYDNDGVGSVRASYTNGRYSTNDRVGFGAYNNALSRVLIVGTGSTSATTSLLVQNSSGTNSMSVTDDGIVTFHKGTYMNAASQDLFHTVDTGGGNYGGLVLKNNIQDYAGYITTGRSGNGNSINFLHTTFAGAFSANPIQQFNASSVTLGRSNGTSPNILTVYGTPVFNITSNATINVAGSTNTTNTGAKLAFQCGTMDTGSPIDSGGIVVFKTNVASPDNINTRMVFYNRENTTLVERMRIADSGNVLIGTTTDSVYKLDVNGTARVSGALTVNTSTVNNIIFSNVGTSNSSYMRWLYNPDNTNNVKTLLYIHKTGLQNGSTYIAPTAQSGNDTYAPTGNNNYVFGGGTSLTTGSSNVFIGNLSGGSVTTGNTNVFIGKGIGGNSVSTGSLNIGIAPEEMLSGERSNTIVIGNIATGGVALDIDNAAVIGGMRINTLYVGAYKTGIPGSAYYQTNFTIASAGGSGTDIIGTSLTLAGGRGTGTGTPGNLIFSTATATTTGTTLQTLSERMRITGTGNVGVGEASPTARLQVKGSGSTSATTSLLVQNSAGTTSLSVNDAGTVTTGGDIFAGNIQIGKGKSTGIYNVAMGQYVLAGLVGSSTSAYTTAIGQAAGGNIASGNHNVIIGAEVAQQSTGMSSSVLIGSKIFGNVTSAINNTLAIGTGNTSNYYPTIYATNINTDSPNVRIGNNSALTAAVPTAPTASAILELSSTTKGFLPPQMTTAQKNAISSPANGLIVYDTDLVRPCFFNGATWITL